MRILVDMDDTIEQLLKAWVGWVNDKYGTKTTVEDVTEWDVSMAFPGLSRDQVYEALYVDELWDTVEPVPDAPEVLKRLIDKGHEVVIVTASPYRSLSAKMEKVLFRYFPYISWNDVIITSRKQMIRADVLIDDGIHNLEGGEYKKILFDSSNNRQYDAEGNGMVRVYTWKDVEAVIDRMAAEE